MCTACPTWRSKCWLVDIDARTIEVWRPGAEHAEHVTGSITWRVGDASFDVPFTEIFRGV